MDDGDFRHSEQSVVLEADDTLRIEHVGDRRHRHGAQGVGARARRRGRRRHPMDVAALRDFLAEQIAQAAADDVLFSVHLKATMMKVSDPIIFGHVVRAFFPALFQEHGDALAEAGVSPERRPRRPAGRRRRRCPTVPPSSRPSSSGLAAGPRLAMVDSDRGITNLHVPSDVIVDASMPAMIRTSGPHVGTRRPGGRHPRGDPRLVVRRHLPGRHRRLPRARRLRPGDHGLGPERRADGAGGRGVRLARQDVRDRRDRHGPRRRRGRRRRCSSTTCRRGRHLAGVPDQGRPDPRLGQARRHPRPRARGDPAVFWLDATAPTTPT